MLKRTLLCIYAFLLISCGFHLRGLIDMPPWLNNVAIIIENAHHDLLFLLTDQFRMYKIFSPSAAQANYLLVIKNDHLSQQIVHVAASTAPRQYQLIYDVQFTLTDTKGRVIIPLSHVKTFRQFTQNNDRILGSNFEEAQLAKEMRIEAARQIINQLSRHDH